MIAGSLALGVQCQLSQKANAVNYSNDGRPTLFGVNMAGMEFDDGSHPVDNAYYEYYLSQGFSFFRIPFKWSRVQPELFGDLDEEQLGELHRQVARASANDAWIALDMHNYMRRGLDGNAEDGIIGLDPKVPVEAYADAWSRLAQEFGNERIMFNLMNEPYGLPDALNVANQNRAAAAIRSVGASNTILFSTNHFSGAHQFNYDRSQMDAALAFRDPGENWMLDIHQYLDTDYKGQGEEPSPDYSAPAVFDVFTAFCRDNGIRAILGEFNLGRSAPALAAIDSHLTYVDANSDVFAGWAYWHGGQGADSAYWQADPYILDPATLRNPAPRPQMTILQAHMRPSAEQ